MDTTPSDAIPGGPKRTRDEYVNFAQLALHEADDAYRIRSTLRNSSIALIAPHGGKIEPGTSEICLAIAGNQLTHYLFEGCKPTSNRDLHITSDRFDEPQALNVAQSAQVVVTIHGQSGNALFINVGGRHQRLGQLLIDHLGSVGYRAARLPQMGLQGMHPNNICNRGKTGQGVQLEISRALRDHLSRDGDELGRFVAIVRQAFQQHQY